ATLRVASSRTEQKTNYTSHKIRTSKSRMTSQPATERPEGPPAVLDTEGSASRKPRRRGKSRQQSKPAAAPDVESDAALYLDDDDDDLELPSYGKRFDRGTKEKSPD